MRLTLSKQAAAQLSLAISWACATLWRPPGLAYLLPKRPSQGYYPKTLTIKKCFLIIYINKPHLIFFCTPKKPHIFLYTFVYLCNVTNLLSAQDSKLSIFVSLTTTPWHYIEKINVLLIFDTIFEKIHLSPSLPFLPPFIMGTNLFNNFMFLILSH